jgi:hypothetical protein
MSASFLSFGQEYFNNRYNITGEWLWDYSTTIIQENDGYILGAETGSPDNMNRRRIAIVKIDLFGNQQWLKTYGEPGIYYCAGYPGFLISTEDNSYALSGAKASPYPGWIRDEGMLMRLNENLDTLWSKLYGDLVEPCDSAYLFRQLICLEDHGYAIIGDFMNSIEWRPQIYIARTDSSGDILWNRWLGDTSGLYYPYSISSTSDNGFVIGGEYYPSNIQNRDPVLFKLDSIGNTKWFRNIGSPFRDYHPFLDTTIDGKIIVGTIISDSSYSSDLYYGRIYYLKLDNEGNIIWDRKYGRSQIANRLWSIKALDNGNIISTGSRMRVWPETPYRIGWILCANSDGDSLWYREYTYLNGEHSENYFYDIIPTYDNGFIACGAGYPAPPDTGTQDCWVVKVDSIGCESPAFCWTVIQEPKVQIVDKGTLILCPNPAAEKVQIRLNDLTGQEHRELKKVILFDLFGRRVMEKDFMTETSLEAGRLNAGIYLVVAEQDGLVLARGKLVVL